MTRNVRRTIAIYEMLTFVATLVNVGVAVSAPSVPVAGLMWLVIAIMLLLSLVSLVAGILLWQDKPPARSLSIIVQALQVPRIAIPGVFRFSLSLGLSIVPAIGIVPRAMRLPLHLSIGIGSLVNEFYLGINVLALTALILLARWRTVGAPASEPSVERRDDPDRMLILIAGPYRSGTGDDPAKLAENVREMESYALPLFRAGHVPIVGEWLALPLVALAGSKRIGDAAFSEIFHPIAERLLARCDGVLRVGGASQGADMMVQTARSHGLAVFHSLDEVPGHAEA
jgi:hypothetical protein